MSILAQFSVVPLGAGASVSEKVARALKIVMESGIAYRIHAMGTVVEGDWEQVLGVIARCHQEVRKDSERVLTTISIDDRGGSGRLDAKIDSVEQRVGRKLAR